MLTVRIKESYEKATQGRHLQDALHHEDDTPGIVARIEDADKRPTDDVISETTYQAEATAIRAYNAALPPLVVAPTRQETLRAALQSANNVSDLKVVLDQMIDLL